jgi:plasmid stability protein
MMELRMGDLLIRNIADAVKIGLAERARQSGRSLSDEANLRLARSLAADERQPRMFENAFDAIRSAFVEADALMTDEEHAEFRRA